MDDELFPSLNIDQADLIDNADEDTEIIQKQDINNIAEVPKFDFTSLKFEVIDGKAITVKGKDALEQWIYLLLKTYQDEFEVYKNTDFYCNITKDIFGNKLDDYWASELENEITEKLLLSPYIYSIDNFEIVDNKDTIDLSFVVTTYNAETIPIQETLKI
jgi:hypothetical protein